MLIKNSIKNKTSETLESSIHIECINTSSSIGKIAKQVVVTVASGNARDSNKKLNNQNNSNKN